MLFTTHTQFFALAGTSWLKYGKETIFSSHHTLAYRDQICNPCVRMYDFMFELLMNFIKILLNEFYLVVRMEFLIVSQVALGILLPLHIIYLYGMVFLAFTFIKSKY